MLRHFICAGQPWCGMSNLKVSSSRTIVLLLTSLCYGGAETQVFNVARILKGRGWDVHVISLCAPQAYADELAEAGVRYYSLEMQKGFPDPRALLKLCRLMRTIRPRVVHSHMIHANIMARVARSLCHIPALVCTAHSLYEGGTLRQLAYRFTDPLCDLTTNVCQAGVDRSIRIRTVPAHKVLYVPNGIDTARFSEQKFNRTEMRVKMGLAEQFVWLAVGRFEAAKDYENMLRSFKMVRQDSANALLLIAGDGPLKEAAMATAASSLPAGSVHFLGIRKDIPELMHAADAYVMSSAWEGTPLVLLEAASSGLPIVATDVGGNSSVVLDGESGYLVPPRTPDELAARMLSVMSLPAEARSGMGRVGRLHIEQNFSLDRVVDLWEQIYAQYSDCETN